MADVVLYDYWRSSAAYRVRIALNLLGIEYEAKVISLIDADHRAPDFVAKNPQGLVPALEIDGQFLTQSLTMIEYLNETRPDARFLPEYTMDRARVRTLSYAIAMEIHPICNLRTINHVMGLTDGDNDDRIAWMRKFIGDGLEGLEGLLQSSQTGKFCHGDQPTMADLCLIPQLYNATRWQVDFSGFEQICRVTDACNELKAFQDAHPDAVNG